MARHSAATIREGSTGAPNAPTAGGGGGRGAGVIVPFTQGSKPEIEPGPSFTKVKPSAAAQELGPVTVPANGFIGAILIDVEQTLAAKKGTGELAENSPFTFFELVRLTEPNGAPLGLELTGWHTVLANIYGGVAGLPDPRDDPDFKNELENFSFTLRIPVEISPNALGALGNQSAAAALRLTLRVNPEASIYKKAVEANGEWTVRTFVELWGEPPATDMFGDPIKQNPDYEGTAQYWSEQAAVSVAKGANNIKLTRVGSQIRCIVFEFIKSALRNDEVAPNPLEIQLDNRIFRQYTLRVLRKIMKESVIRLKANTKDTGIYALMFNKGEGRLVGDNAFNSWLPTLTGTRLELRGTAEAAGEVNILTNDVSVTAVNPTERTQQVGVGGYHPPIGQTNYVAG
jgi:hypothetical protein